MGELEHFNHVLALMPLAICPYEVGTLALPPTDLTQKPSQIETCMLHRCVLQQSELNMVVYSGGVTAKKVTEMKP